MAACLDTACSAAYKDFMWELAHGRLLTNEARWRRNLPFSGDCKCYVGEMETTLHVVRDYRNAS